MKREPDPQILAKVLRLAAAFALFYAQKIDPLEESEKGSPGGTRSKKQG